MKVKTVGALAGLAVMVTSATVWSVTPPGGFADRLAAPARAVGIRAPVVDLAQADFIDGATIHLEGRLGHPSVAADRGQETFLFARAEAPAGTKATQAAPLDLAIVIDRSGSMAGKRLDNALEAARGMVRRLRDGDVVSIITYDTQTQTLVSPTAIHRGNREDVVVALDRVSVGGDTCISCAIEAGMRALQDPSAEGMVKRVLLLSDGKATSGVRDIAGFDRLAQRARDMGCSISAVGVDVDFDEQIMAALARGSNGHHTFVENPADLPRMFDEELRTLTSTVAIGGQMRVRLAPGVRLVEVMGRQFRREGDEVVVPIGAMSAGDERTPLLRVSLPAGAAGVDDVADIRFAYDDLVTGQRGNCGGELRTRRLSDPGAVTPMDPQVATRVQRAETAASLEEANRLFLEGQRDEARQQLQRAREQAQRNRGWVGRRAPKKWKRKLAVDFDDQIAALDEAEQSFAPAPAEPATASGGPPRPRPKPKAQMKRNTERALQMDL